MNHRASSETGRSDADGISMTRSPSLSSSSSVKSYRHKWSARKQPLSTVRSSSNLPSPSPDSNLGSAEGFDVYGSDASVSYEGNPMANARAALVQLQDRVRSAYTSGMLTEPFDTDLIDELFELALEAEHGHLGDIQKDAMRKISPEGKLHVISSVASRQEPKHLTDGDKQPLYYIEFINQAAADTVHGKKRAQQLVGLVTRLSSGSGGKQPHLKDVLEELKVQCSCQSLSWVLNFLDLGGLPALFTLLHAMHRKHDSKLKHFEIESEILKILKIVVNQNRGITELLNNSRYLSIIVLSLDSPLLSARTSAADFLLALVTIEYPRGHKLVMGAFEHFRAAHDDLHTFQRLVSALDSLVQTRGVFGTTVGSRSENSLLHFGDKNREQTQRDIKDFLISTVTLLRLVVDVPPELEYRIHLRNELMASGFGKILKTLRTWASQEFAEILTHVDAFEYRAAADHQDFADDLESLTGIDLDDPNGLLEGLLGSFAEGDGGKDYVLSILQHLLIPARLIDGPSKAKVFRLLDLMVAQVVLDRNGLDPGFTDMYKISVEEVMEGISEEVAAENELLRAKVIFNEAVRKPSSANFWGSGTQEDALHALQKKLDAANLEHQKALEQHREELSEILHAVRNRPPGGGSGGKEDMEARRTQTALEPGPILAPGVLPAPPAPLLASASEPAFFPPSTSESEISNVPPVPPSPGLGGPPPPPPPPFTGGGPPPPPPPMMGGPPPPPPMMGGPPPPPGAISLGPVLRPQKFRPAVHVRKFAWEKVNDMQAKETIWGKKLQIKTKLESVDDSENDKDMENQAQKLGVFEEVDVLFAVKPPKVEEVDTNAKSNKEVTLIDPKKAQNIGIFLANSKHKHLTPRDWRAAVLAADEGMLTDAVTGQLLAYAPSREDVAMLMSHAKSDGPPLAKADQFLFEMSKINRLEERLTAINFRAGFQERCNKLKEDISTAYTAFEALQTSDAFAGVLELILTVGNYLNTGSLSGGAHGFRIANINRLASTKAVTKTSLLRFIAGTIDTKFPEMESFMDDFRGVYPAVRICYDELQDELDAIRENITQVRSELRAQKDQQGQTHIQNDPDMKDCFVAQMEVFLAKANDEYTHIKAKHSDMWKAFEECVVFYGEETARTKPEEFLSIFTTFMDSYTAAAAENKVERARKDREEKRQKAREERDAKRRNTQEKNIYAIPAITLPTVDKDGSGGLAMDDLLASLKRGNSSAGPLRTKRYPITVAAESDRKASTASIGNRAMELLGRLREQEI